MESPRRIGIESLSIGYLIVAFAVSLLIAWSLDDWILTVPVFLLAAGVFYTALSFVVRGSPLREGQSPRISSYYLFWGTCIAIVGAMWLVNREYPGNAALLIILFILWIGIMAVVFSLPRLRKS